MDEVSLRYTKKQLAVLVTIKYILYTTMVVLVAILVISIANMVVNAKEASGLQGVAVSGAKFVDTLNDATGHVVTALESTRTMLNEEFRDEPMPKLLDDLLMATYGAGEEREFPLDDKETWDGLAKVVIALAKSMVNAEHATERGHEAINTLANIAEEKLGNIGELDIRIGIGGDSSMGKREVGDDGTNYVTDCIIVPLMYDTDETKLPPIAKEQ